MGIAADHYRLTPGFAGRLGGGGGRGPVINYRVVGGTKWENRRSQTFCTHPSIQGKKNQNL